MINKLIDRVLEGLRPSMVVENCVNSGSHLFDQNITFASRRSVVYPVRTYFDSYGDLRFSTLEGVLIDHISDPVMMEIVNLVDSDSSDSDLIEMLGEYEGSLDDLYRLVTTKFNLADIANL